MYSKRPIILGLLVLVGLVAWSIREQVTIATFDREYAAILAGLSKEMHDTAIDRERLPQFYKLVGEALEAVKELPRVRNPVRMVWRQRLGSLCHALVEINRTNPLEAGTDELLQSVSTEIRDLQVCFEEGVEYQDEGF